MSNRTYESLEQSDALDLSRHSILMPVMKKRIIEANTNNDSYPTEIIGNRGINKLLTIKPVQLSRITVNHKDKQQPLTK